MKRRVLAFVGIAFAAMTMAGCPEDEPTAPQDLSAVPSVVQLAG